MKHIRSKIDIAIRLTPSERIKYNDLWNQLENTCKISSKQKSQVIMEAFFEHAENLISSYQDYTQTNRQITDASEKQAFFDEILLKLSNEDMFLLGLVNVFFGEYENRNFSHDPRTISRHFISLLKNKSINLIDLSQFVPNIPENMRFIVFTDKNPLYNQLKNICFKSKFNKAISSQTGSRSKWVDSLFYALKNSSQTTYIMDRVEKYHFDKLLFDRFLTEIKPINFDSDIILREVTEFRSKKLFNDANDLIEKEKIQSKNISIDNFDFGVNTQ